MGLSALLETLLIESETIRCDLSRHLVRDGILKSVRCVGTRVTREGLHIVSYDELDVGTMLRLLLKEGDLSFFVFTCRADAIRPSVFHIVLKLSDNTVDIFLRLESEGLFQRKAPRQIAIGACRITLVSLREAVAQANTPDPSLLRLIRGRADESKAFPLEIDGQSLIALIPVHLKAQDILEMQDEELFEKIVILTRKCSHQGDSRWVKAWPERQ